MTGIRQDQLRVCVFDLRFEPVIFLQPFIFQIKEALHIFWSFNIVHSVTSEIEIFLKFRTCARSLLKIMAFVNVKLCIGQHECRPFCGILQLRS